MKRFLLFLLFILSFIITKAQVSMAPHFNAGIEYGLPTGSISNYYGTVVGASAKFELPISDPRLAGVLTAGFSEYVVKLTYDGPLNLKATSFIPVEAGLRYYFSNLAYFEGNAGISFNNDNSFIGKSTAFVYSPVVGISAPTNKHKGSIDVGLRYESRSGGVNQMALRLAYRFGPTVPKVEKVKDKK